MLGAAGPEIFRLPASKSHHHHIANLRAPKMPHNFIYLFLLSILVGLSISSIALKLAVNYPPMCQTLVVTAPIVLVPALAFAKLNMTKTTLLAAFVCVLCWSWCWLSINNLV